MAIDPQTWQRIANRIPEVLSHHFDVSKQILAAEVTGRYMVDAGESAEGTPNPRRGRGTLRIITGRLARSFENIYDSRAGKREGVNEVIQRGDEIIWRYGSSTPYADENELGIGKPARPFFGPAIEATDEEREDLLADSFQQAVLEEIDKDNRR